MAAVSIVNGNVWVNIWATAYALPMWRRTHGAVRECWHERFSCEYSYIYTCYASSVGTLTVITLRTVIIRLNIYRERRNFVLCYRR